MSRPLKTTKVICFSNHKGGVGKTCTACNIGAGISRKGHRVLLVDLDPQSNLSLSLGVKDAEINIYSVLTGQTPLSKAILNISENLDLLPSNLDLAGAEMELAAEAGREFILKEILKDVYHKYEYILIDCAPSLGLLTTNALTAATDVLIPLQPQYLSLQGMSKLTDIIAKIQKRLNENLVIGGVVITQFDSRKILNRDVAEAIERHFAGKVFRTKIRENVALAEAPGHGKDIFRYDSKCKGALDYAALCDEVIEKYR